MSWGYSGDPDVNLNENNPFLEMIAAIDGEEEQQQPPPQQGAAAVQNNDNNGAGRVKLPDFWPHAPGIWFARAELHFEVSNVIHERQKFAYTVDALPYETLCHVVDLVEASPAFNAYTVLKERLMLAHQLTPIEKAMKLMEQPHLGDRRPSQLLADLLQVCPPGEQNTAFFKGAFISRLLAELCAHLTNVEATDLKELAQRADQLWATHRRPSPLAAVAGEQVCSANEEALLTAVQARAAGKGKQVQRKKKLITYCYLHHKFSKDARHCDNLRAACGRETE
jgi:hypothetical protein